jgi:hypothetical protein
VAPLAVLSFTVAVLMEPPAWYCSSGRIADMILLHFVTSAAALPITLVGLQRL